MARRYQDVTDAETGLRFRFYFDRDDPDRLHIDAAHGVTMEEAINTFHHGVVGPVVWLEGKRCYKTFSATHVVAWLWLDETHSRVLIITCVRLDED